MRQGAIRKAPVHRSPTHYAFPTAQSSFASRQVNCCRTTPADRISQRAIVDTFDLRLDVHHRSAHSTNASGVSSRTITTHRMRPPRNNSALPRRAAARVGQRDHAAVRSVADQSPVVRLCTRALLGRVPWHAHAFLDSSGMAKTVAEYRRERPSSRRGTPARVSSTFKRAASNCRCCRRPWRVTLGVGDFFGEGCLGPAGQPVRMGGATAITPSVILFVGKEKMIRLLHQQHAMSDRFISHMLSVAVKRARCVVGSAR